MALPDDVLTSAIDFGAYLGGDGAPAWTALGGRLTPVHPETFRPISLLHVESGDVITSSGVFFEVNADSTQSPQVVRSGTGAFSPDDFLWSMRFAGWGDSPPNRVFALSADSDDVVDYDRLVPAESRPQVFVPVVTSVEAVTEAQDAADAAAASAAAVQTAVATSAALAAAAQEAAESAASLVTAAQAAAQMAADAAAGAITPAQLSTALATLATSTDLATLAGRVSTAETTLAAATDVMTAGTIVKRSAGGTFRINAVTALTAPSAVDHLTRKDYVDGRTVDVAVPTYAGSRTRLFDNALSVYGGDPATRLPLRLAIGKALAGNALVPILFMGDSATAGWKATPGKDDPVMQLRNLIKSAGYPVTGGWVFAGNGTGTSLDTRWTRTGTWQGMANTDNNYLWTTQSGASTTFTSDLPGTIAEFAFFAANGVTVNYSIDGGATTPVVTNGVLQQVQVTGLANTTHTITITTTSTSTVWVAAARVRATTGVSISNGGIFGSRANQWIPTYNTSAFFNPINLTLGLENPALVVVGLGGNEASHAGFTVAGMTSSLVTIGQTVQAKCPVVMQTYLPIDDATISAVYPGMKWGDWVKGMYDAADTLGAMLIDHTAQMGTNAALITAGLMYTDKLHPLPPGYADIARRDYRAIVAA